MTEPAGGRAAERAALLRELEVLDVRCDPEVDGVVRVAAALTGMPYATVHLLDGEDQRQLSPHGFPGGSAPGNSSVGAVLAGWEPGVYAFDDLAAHPRFATNPWVDGRRSRLRGYASAHLVIDGVTVGTLAVMDDRPHALTDDDRDRLGDLAAVIVGVFVRRRALRQLADVAAATTIARREAEQAHAELTRSEAFVRALLDALPVGVVAADAEGRLSLFNEVSRRWHGLDAQPDIAPGDLASVFSLTDPAGRLLEPHEVPLARAFAERRISDVEIRIAPVGRAGRLLSTSGCEVRGEDGELLGAVIAMADVTAQRELEQALRRAALHDPLTGLPNRSLLLDRLEQLLPPGRRSPVSLAVLFCDLDGFKPVNDAAGHAVGDEVLVRAVERLTGAVRPGDTVARVGGDEFVVLCPGVPSEEAAQEVADRMDAAFDIPLRSSRGTEHRVGVSVGVALCTPDDTPDTALAAADAAMYRIKSRRRSARAVPA
ncbi:GGDEF domain-containing protein [Geodermatophilus sabuli]|uniref:Diguanylate cyclase (GGDEF) domain-containing protein n=1 Tax=Geodermatophilus sabuli TaxID=1564158 RepID=A0A285EI91_9ACTN|nr:GGDEF domain-containing protein [Geodermatophilus sabuli]MBB3086777.1 diguanylate cyclase (GGDEF)-like protein [Geodermatophilus sabuli]SNX98849.1 diguanylate cyclase (GGDEF) domain-containing protein [Geodermatophilus sabuli]